VTRAILFGEVACFYAEVERADDPTLEGHPIIVGGDPHKRGLVQAASSEALAAGVTTDLTVLEALKLCPHARATRTNMRRYREVSRQLFACLRRGFDWLEPYGLGAAYFDVTGAGDPPEVIAQSLRSLVADELGLPLRVGIASGKFLARLAAQEAGPPGWFRIPSSGEADFLSPFPVTRLEGVGEKTAATLAELGAERIGELIEIGPGPLQEALGTHGLRVHAYAAGRDDRPVRAARHPQSVSREATLTETRDLDVLAVQLQELAASLEAELRSQRLSASRVILKVRFADRVTTTRSQTLTAPIASAAGIQQVAVRLLARTQAGSRPSRGLGIQLGSLQHEGEGDRQLDLFPR
jgi:DNA polymerase-4